MYVCRYYQQCMQILSVQYMQILSVQCMQILSVQRCRLCVYMFTSRHCVYISGNDWHRSIVNVLYTASCIVDIIHQQLPNLGIFRTVKCPGVLKYSVFRTAFLEKHIYSLLQKLTTAVKTQHVCVYKNVHFNDIHVVTTIICTVHLNQ